MSVLEAADLVMEYRGAGKATRSLDGVSLSLEPGEIFALVGESGSGKSTFAGAIGRLPVPGLVRVAGELTVVGFEVEQLDDAALNRLRQNEIGYIFQDPVATLDPTMRIGRQIQLALAGNWDAVEGAMSGLGLPDIGRVIASYPHEISGGMAQRVAIGIALARKPRLIIADEPTAALDASIKSLILDLLVTACKDVDATLLLVTHDLHVVRKYADRVAVMYGGRVVEVGKTSRVLNHPVHPYTSTLLRAAVGREKAGERVEPIPGMPPHLDERLEACAFAPRCAHAQDRCRTERPEARSDLQNQAVCHFADELAGEEPV